MLTPAVIVATVTAVVGPVLVVIATAVTARRRAEKAATTPGTDPERAQDISVSAVVLDWAEQLRADVDKGNARVDALNTKVDELNRTVLLLERENSKLRRYVEILAAQVVDLGGRPYPQPD